MLAVAMDRRPGRFRADKNRGLVRDVLTFKGYEVIEIETGRRGRPACPRAVSEPGLMDI
jgi:hypothetical protein